MKTVRKFLAVGLAIVAAVACRPSGGKDVKTELREYDDSTAHADLSIKAELPVPGQGAVAERIRTALVEVMDEQLSHLGTYEEDRLFPSFDGNVTAAVGLEPTRLLHPAVFKTASLPIRISSQNTESGT